MIAKSVIIYDKRLSTVIHTEREVELMKELYRKPVLEVVDFDCEDIITTSGPSTGDYGTDILPD